MAIPLPGFSFSDGCWPPERFRFLAPCLDKSQFNTE